MLTMYTDKALTCSECSVEFAFTVEEQEFHAAKGFTNLPGRCPDCRAARKAQRDSAGYGRSSTGQRELFSATCATCSKEALVPFQPRGDRPVYCSDCFRAQPATNGRGNRW
jgi:CxxC-x17-CxxC domain-containing protein